MGADLRVLVLGGSGFIGRHAVAALVNTGAEVVIGTRNPARMSGHIPDNAKACERREVRLEALTDVDPWPDLIEDVDVVLNCVGILRQRGAETYDKVHHLAPEAIAATCAALGKRFVHVSALGLSGKMRSRFLTSKVAGEQRVKNSGADWIIARPSLIDGDGGFGARWLRGISKLPLYAAPMDARGLIAALDVDDLGEALARLCVASAAELRLEQSREFDLGGTETFEFRDYISGLRKNYTDAPILRIPVPGIAARAFAHVCDVLHFTPFSFGHWELLRKDNVPRPNRLPELIGREPTPVAPRHPRQTRSS